MDISSSSTGFFMIKRFSVSRCIDLGAKAEQCTFLIAEKRLMEAERASA